jgi:hypothetical protein
VTWWREAMKEEMKALYKNNTWEFVKLPNGKRQQDVSGCLLRSINPMVL